MASGNSTTRTVFRPVPSHPGDSPSGDSPGVSKPVPPTPLPCRASPWHHPPVIHHRVPEKVGVDRDCPPRAKSRPPKPKPTTIPIPRAIFPVKTGPFVRSIAARRGPSPDSLTGAPDHSSTSGVSRPTGTPQANPGGIRAHRAAGMASGKPWIDTQAIR